MIDPKCPDCGKPLEQIPDLAETIYKCISCHVEYDDQDLTQFETDFIWDEKNVEEFPI